MVIDTCFFYSSRLHYLNLVHNLFTLRIPSFYNLSPEKTILLSNDFYRYFKFPFKDSWFHEKNTARKPLRSLHTVSSTIYVLEGGQLSLSRNIICLIPLG